MRILTTALVAAFLCLNAAHAETYIRGMGGTNFDWAYEHNDFDLETRNGYSFCGAGGTEVGEAGDLSFAVEGEFCYSRSPVENLLFDADLASMGLMGNGLVRYDPGIPVRPYIGAGLGLGVNSFQFQDSDVGSAADPGLAWQAIAGVNFKINHRWSLDLQYRYMGEDFSSPGDKINNDHLQAPRRHVAMAGITMCLTHCYPYW